MFNKIIQACRSNKETRFADIGYEFQRFHHKSLIKVSSSKIYNLQFKVVCLLMNIYKFVEDNYLEPDTP